MSERATRARVEPALTPEEWAAGPDAHLVCQGRTGWEGGEPGHEPLYFPTRHGIAAVNLHKQPGGFTWEDVRKHREAANGCRRRLQELAIASQLRAPAPDDFFGVRTGERVRAQLGWHESMADRIEALLPPEEP